MTLIEKQNKSTFIACQSENRKPLHICLQIKTMRLSSDEQHFRNRSLSILSFSSKITNSLNRIHDLLVIDIIAQMIERIDIFHRISFSVILDLQLSTRLSHITVLTKNLVYDIRFHIMREWIFIHLLINSRNLLTL